MTTPAERTTAQIIPFPAGGLRARREFVQRMDRKAPEANPALCDLAFGGSWYHEEAVRDSASPKGKLS
ncbi:DUF2735 domain-containing protein [Rhizobium helianthi]|uniref:DUF2735 domain-containing protein n=1 Tax=Rhizobium helianthi TaxID=1132695 RepID=A0ABW4M6D7_9HYPH